MPRVKGFLRILRHRDRFGRLRPVDPDYGVEGPVDPDYGVEEGGEIDQELPEAPPGIWPPPSIGHPIQPLPPARPGGPGRPTKPVQPDEGEPDQELPGPPGSIWPRPPGRVSGYFIALCHIPGYGWRYIVIDPDGWELPETLPEGGEAPGQGLPGRPTRPATPDVHHR
jgi:hypothetical protein